MITKIQVDLLAQRLASKEIELTVDHATLDYLARAGYDPVYGARPLKRSIQHYLENPLAQALLKGEFVSGDKITVSVQDNDLIFKSV